MVVAMLAKSFTWLDWHYERVSEVEGGLAELWAEFGGRWLLVFLNIYKKIPQAYRITVVAFTRKYSGYRISIGNGGISSS
jgi:hypothetical protein